MEEKERKNKSERDRKPNEPRNITKLTSDKIVAVWVAESADTQSALTVRVMG